MGIIEDINVCIGSYGDRWIYTMVQEDSKGRRMFKWWARVSVDHILKNILYKYYNRIMYENNFIVDAKIEIIIKSDVVEPKKEPKKRAKKIKQIKQKKWVNNNDLKEVIIKKIIYRI